MSQEAFKLIGVVEAQTGQAEKNLRQVDRVAQQTAKNMGTSLRGSERDFLAAGRGASSFLERFSQISQVIQGIPQIGQLAGALTRPLFNAAEEGIKLNMTLESAAIGYEQVAGSAKKAQQFLDKLQSFGQHSPFRFEGLLQASQLMTAMGFDLNEQIPKLKIWGNAIASSGQLSADKIHDVVVAFGQMRMAGRVNSQDMMQLTNANIPGWQLLAKAIGKTVEETRKLAEGGRLNGTAAVEAMTAMMAQDSRFKGMMDRLQNTAAGRMSAAEDTLQIAQAKATKGLTANISETIGALLNKEGTVNNLADKINSLLTPVSGAIKGTLTSALEGNADGLKNAAKDVLGSALSGGLTQGISEGIGDVTSAIGSLVTQGVVNPFKQMLGINSPSKVFIQYGHDSAEGYTQGFAEGLYDGTFDTIIERFLGHVEGKLTATKTRSAENLAKLMQREPGFKPKLIAGAQKRGINPDDLLNVMAVETAGSFNPGIKNPTSSASGLIQFMAETAKALGTTTELLRQMSATQQLDYVFKYFDKFFAGRDLSTQGAVYAAVGAGKVGSSDNSVLMTRSSRGYAGNAATWDPNRDGIVRQGEMAAAAQNKLGAGVNFSINGSAVSNSNPVPVSVVAAMNGAFAAYAAAVNMPAADRKRLASTGPGPKVSVDTTISAGLAGPQVGVDTNLSAGLTRLRTVNKELHTTATQTLPAAGQALGQVAEVAEQKFKAAGQYAKDVITQSEEAIRRVKFDWNAVGAGFESALQDSFRSLFSGGKFFKEVLPNAARLFGQEFARSIGDEASRQFSAILGSHLFNFDGGSSQSDGGLVGNMVRGLLGKLGIGKKSSSGGSDDVQGFFNDAMQHAAEMNRGGTRPRRVGTNGSMPAAQNTGVDTSISNGITTQVLQNSTDKVVSGQQAQTGQLTASMSGNTDRIIEALTPTQESFWKGLLRATLSAAAGGAAGAATNGVLGGGGSSSGGGGGAGEGTGHVTVTATETDAPAAGDATGATRPRRVGGHWQGGIINGPGSTTSDSILGIDPNGVPTAMVSRGEFVVNAEATRKNRAALELINETGKLPRRGLGGFLSWTSPISHKSVRDFTMPITHEGFRNFAMPIMNDGFRNATMPALGYLNSGQTAAAATPGAPANLKGSSSPTPETHNHYHFNVYAQGPDAAQSIQKSRRQLERQAAQTLGAAVRQQRAA
jgi:tape measure domain-containing protein